MLNLSFLLPILALCINWFGYLNKFQKCFQKPWKRAWRSVSAFISWFLIFKHCCIISIFQNIWELPTFPAFVEDSCQFVRVSCMEADCHIFLINLLYRFFGFDIPSISLDILDMSFPMSLSLFKEPGITITNLLDLLFRTINLV